MSDRRLPTDQQSLQNLLQTTLDRLYRLENADGGGGFSGSGVTGQVTAYAGASAPFGWVICDGSSYPRIGIYAALFAVIGTTYGSVDGSHFNVPDLRGRVLVGLGTNADVNARGASDGLGVANRSPKHNTTNGLSFSGGSSSTGGESNTHVHVDSGHGHGVDDPGHAHDLQMAYSDGSTGGEPAGSDSGLSGDTFSTNGSGTGISVQTGNAAIGANTSDHTHGFTSTGSITGSIGPGGSRPTDTPAFLVMPYIIKL